jgi:hypothetical protein
MAVTYTTAAIVRKRVSAIPNALTDPNIEENIEQAEGIVDAIMLCSFKDIFDNTKHGIIRQCTTDLAAFLCLTYDPAEFEMLETAEMTANMLWNSADRSLFILSRKRVVESLRNE